MERLVDRHRSTLFGYIVNMTGGRDDADEIFQEVWLRVIRKLGRYRHKNFRGWLVRIAHNIIIDRTRRKKPTFSLDEEGKKGGAIAEAIPGNAPAPFNRIEESELGRHIAVAVATLPVEQREVFLMRTKMDLSFKEVARIQKTSINTALARMQYALGKLRPLLKKEYEELARQ